MLGTLHLSRLVRPGSYNFLHRQFPKISELDDHKMLMSLQEIVFQISLDITSRDFFACNDKPINYNSKELWDFPVDSRVEYIISTISIITSVND